ncbi:hypothetical protein POL68_20190 [Stigmatella sp. ncwal1]|uniref:Lipoprotein n=1 Tax=Stigmatella ashevillensis TaxID=2995309 RepID=A0ABT5DEQ6_9BACT|nr:hypothetical protein [Stigmatella ashevillena]MDC0710807.1 hypothetical protein [Stigmatella ashevillena]
MGRRAWMGVIGVCALLTGCQGRESTEQAAPAASARTPAPSRPVATTAPAQEGNSEVATAGRPTAPAQTAAPQRTASTVGRTTLPGAAPGPVTSTAPQGAPAPTQGTQAAAPAADPATDEGRVMIGSDAIQASEDEDWYKGAARAAKAFQENNNQPLEQVVIATGSVDGKISRVSQGAVHVRDPEGNVYQLRIDKKSRGLRQGQRVPLKELDEGTPVRASFDLVGGGSIARDIEVRR